MPSLNFMAQFAGDVEAGRKTQSIRATNRFKVGDTVYLYTGMGQKGCRKLGEGTVVSVSRVMISNNGFQWKGMRWDEEWWKEACAHCDGFDSWAQMRDWFDKAYGLPFRGWLIKWRKTK